MVCGAIVRGDTLLQYAPAVPACCGVSVQVDFDAPEQTLGPPPVTIARSLSLDFVEQQEVAETSVSAGLWQQIRLSALETPEPDVRLAWPLLLTLLVWRRRLSEALS